MIGSIIGAVIGAGASIYGGIKSSQAAKKNQSMLDSQLAENESWFSKNYNQDYTKRADSLRLLERARESAKSVSDRATGHSTVMGATDEYRLAQQQQGNETITDSLSSLGAQGAAYRDQIEQAFRNRQSQLTGVQMDINNNRSKAISEAVGGVGSAVGGSISSISGWKTKLKQE